MNLFKGLLIAVIRIYQWTLSPLLRSLFGDQCRFTPSCSVYGIEAIRTHGVIRGGWLTLRRICRCGPWGGSCGCDPVPNVRLTRPLNF